MGCDWLPVWSDWHHKFIPYTSSRSPIQQIHVKSVSKTITRPVSSVSRCSEVAFLSLFMTVKCVAVLLCMFAYFCACVWHVSGRPCAPLVTLLPETRGEGEEKVHQSLWKHAPSPSLCQCALLSLHSSSRWPVTALHKTHSAKTTFPHALQFCLYFPHFPQIADKI